MYTAVNKLTPQIIADSRHAESTKISYTGGENILYEWLQKNHHQYVSNRKIMLPLSPEILPILHYCLLISRLKIIQQPNQ